MDAHAYYELKVLEHLEDTPFITHRTASDKLGVSVRLSHAVVRGMLKRGWIHATQRDGKSFYYFLTPKGIAEKIRLTYEFLRFSRQFYQEARKRSSEVCRDLAREGVRRIAFLGCGELAEISYLGTTEYSLRLTSVFDQQREGENFLGMTVKPARDINKKRSPRSRVAFDRLLITSYDPAYPMREHYIPPEVTPDERFVWVFDHQKMLDDIAKRVPQALDGEECGSGG